MNRILGVTNELGSWQCGVVVGSWEYLWGQIVEAILTSVEANSITVEANLITVEANLITVEANLTIVEAKIEPLMQFLDPSRSGHSLVATEITHTRFYEALWHTYAIEQKNYI